MRITDAFVGYEIYWLEEGLSPVTLAIYKSALRQMAEYLVDPEINDVTEKRLKEFFGYLRNQYVPRRSDNGRLSSGSMHRYWKAVRSFFKWADIDQHTGRPDLFLKMPKHNSKEIIPFNEDEVQRLLRAAEESLPVEKPGKKAYKFTCFNANRNKAIILTLLDTGLRPSELTRLRIGDLNMTTGDIQVMPFRIGKTRPRVVIVSPRSRKAIWQYLNSRPQG